jgi:hypothetical protein
MKKFLKFTEAKNKREAEQEQCKRFQGNCQVQVGV